MRVATLNTFTHQQMALNDDWKIEQNLSIDAELVSAEANLRMGVRGIFKAQYPDITWIDRKQPFEFPECAEELRAMHAPEDIQEEVKARAPQPKGKAKAKSGPRRPGRSVPVAAAAPPM